MSKAILLVGTQPDSGLTSTAMGLFHALDRKGVKVVSFKPVPQCSDAVKEDTSSAIMQRYGRSDTTLSLTPDEVQQAFATHNLDRMVEKLIQRYEIAKQDADIVILEGLTQTAAMPYAEQISKEIAWALDADIIIVSSAMVESLSQLEYQIRYAAESFGKVGNQRILGTIVNRVDVKGGLDSKKIRSSKLLCEDFRLLSLIPENPNIKAARVSDLQKHLNARIIYAGEMDTRRVHGFVIFARSAPNATNYLLPNNCIFCAADRDDAIMAVTIAASAGTQLACLALMGPTVASPGIDALCYPLLKKSGLPILHIDSSTWDLTGLMNGFNDDIPVDDEERIRKTQEHFAEHMGDDWIDNCLSNVRESVLSPASFRYQIVKRAIAANKRIVLPEGDEPRTVVAASNVAARKIAHCVLLADPENVRQVAAQQGVTIGKNVTIINPASVRENYVARLVKLRASKGMTDPIAREQLEDNVMLGTMMLEAGEVDGLVSGAIHTTANTIRPPLQIIKTAPGVPIVSSVFFMCLPDKVLVYGDCAIVPKPSADELAQIAIQANDTAAIFGITPKVAMISYSTGTSGSGEDVDKVAAATRKVRELRPDIAVDGPLQYDAASVASVAASKAPNFPVAGQATVFIFPDLNTGNTTYKAVQRSASAIAMGPVLQGMRKPVNDLSRGALIDDIIYTIAITAIQATQA